MEGSIFVKVSVAMATYNGEKYVEKQLETIRTQTCVADEVVIYDDQSTDNTFSIVKDYIRRHCLENWTVYISETNRGFIGNFFQVLKKVTGDVIFLCDQDDEWNCNKIKKMIEIMKDNKQIQALSSAVTLIDSQGKDKQIIPRKGYCNANILHKKVEEKELVKIDVPFLIKSNVSPGCTMCITKELKEKFLQYEELCIQSKFPHDWFLNILAAIEDGTCFYNEPFVNYRIHDCNTIGVDIQDDIETSRINSTRTERQEIGKFHLDRAVLLDENLQFNKKDKQYIKKYRKFAERRYEFLKEFSFCKLMKVYKNVKIYYESIELRGMISDVIYALGLDAKFR